MTGVLRHRLLAVLTGLVLAGAVLPVTPAHADPQSLTATAGMLRTLQTQSSTGAYGADLIAGCQWATWVAQCQNLDVYGNGSSFDDSGCGPPNGCTFGPEFQCTELAQRYAFYAWGEPANWYGYGGAGGSAYQMWNAGPALPIGLQQMPQGGGVPPQVGDLLIFGQGWLGGYWDGNGHVAVVSSVNPSSVDIVQENGTPTGRDRLGLSGSTVTANGYTPIIGWLHNPLMGEGKLSVAMSGAAQVAFWRGNDSHLHESWSANGTWNGPVDWTAAWNSSALLMSAPAVVASPANGRQTVLWRSVDGHLWDAVYDAGWTPPVDVSAAWSSTQLLLSAPTAAMSPDGQLVVFWQGANGDLMETWSAGATWQTPSDWTALWGGAGRLNSSPSLAISATGNQLLYWQSANGHLWHAWYSGGWNGPVDESGSWPHQALLASPPSAVVSAAGVETILWESVDGRLWGTWHHTDWHGPVLWDSVGSLSSAPSAVISPNGMVTAYWQGANGDLYSASHTGTWNGPVDLAAGWGSTGLMSGAPAVAITPARQQVVFWRGTNGHLWETWYSGGWSPPVDWSATWPAAPRLASSPTVAVGPDGTQVIFWEGSDGHLWEAWYHDGWHGPVDWTAVWPGAKGLGSAPSVAMTPDGRTQMVFWRGTEGDLWEAWYHDGWNGPVDWTGVWGPGHGLAGAPAAAMTPDGAQQLVYWNDPSGRIDEVWFNGTWNGPVVWSPASAAFGAAPGLAVAPGGRQDVFLQGGEGDLWEAWWAGSFSPPIDVAAAFGLHDAVLSAPAAATLGSGPTIVFWQGTGGHLHEAWTSGTDWSTPVDAGTMARLS